MVGLANAFGGGMGVCDFGTGRESQSLRVSEEYNLRPTNRARLRCASTTFL